MYLGQAPSRLLVGLAIAGDVSASLASRASAHVVPRNYSDGKFCKVFPGDRDWPSSGEWAKLNATVGGALFSPVPRAAPCHSSRPEYDPAKCEELLATWNNGDEVIAHPTDLFYPYFQGESCLPTDNATTSCTSGGDPEYVIKVTKPDQITAAIKFAKEKNVRLIIKNTGHDMLGKSTGAGSLSLWTHNLKQIDWLPEYKTQYYTGPAIRVGAGVTVEEFYEAAEERGVTVVGGEGATVGVAGGYITGGGHSPLGGLYGLAADNVVELTAVLPNGKHTTITPKSEPELFWAFRGGGGATFGVVTSVTVRAYPKLPVTVARWTLTNEAEIDPIYFWGAVRAFQKHMIHIADSGSQAFTAIMNVNGQLTWTVNSFFAPNITKEQYEALMAEYYVKLDEHNVTYAENVTYYSSFLPAWKDAFPAAGGPWNAQAPQLASGSRLIPRTALDFDTDSGSFNNTVAALINLTDVGGGFLWYTWDNSLKVGIPNAVNPAMRDSLAMVIPFVPVPQDAPVAVANTARDTLTNTLIPMLRNVTPGSGAYLGEADVREPNWQQSFFGCNYPRLLKLKKRLDPYNIFYAKTAVGSENWYSDNVGDDKLLPEVQVGRLCKRY